MNKFKKSLLKVSSSIVSVLMVFSLSHVAYAATATIYENSVGGSNQGPVDLVQGPDGNIWYTLGQTGYVGVMGPNGGVINNISLGGNPASITYAQTDGNFYVTVNTTGKIAKISPAGAVIGQYAANCTLPGDIIEDPTNNYIWYTCVDSNEVRAIDPATGNPAGTLINTGSGSNPTGLTFCDGKLWYTLLNTNQIGYANPDGTGDGVFPVTGTLPWQITCDSADASVWYTLKGSGNIQEMDTTTGAVLQTFSPPTINSWPFGITTDASGNLWFAERTGNNIVRMTTAGVFTEFAVKTAGSLPLAVISGPSGNIYFTENGNNAIGKLVVSSINGGGTTPNVPNSAAQLTTKVKSSPVPVALAAISILGLIALTGYFIRTELKKRK